MFRTESTPYAQALYAQSVDPGCGSTTRRIARMRIEMLPERAPLEARLHHLRRRRRAVDPRQALATAAVIVAVAWTAMVGLGLFLR
jgi:hypothetical protein